jgi:hypothetical protein
VSLCRTCGASIQWVETERGKRMPIDSRPSEQGTIVLRHRFAEPPLAIAGVPPEAFPGEPRYTSHFATCPQAADWRKP